MGPRSLTWSRVGAHKREKRAQQKQQGKANATTRSGTLPRSRTKGSSKKLPPANSGKLVERKSGGKEGATHIYRKSSGGWNLKRTRLRSQGGNLTWDREGSKSRTEVKKASAMRKRPKLPSSVSVQRSSAISKRPHKEKALCMFFVRTGKCPNNVQNSRSGRCPFRHDEGKVALCSRWLAGKCSGQGCLLTHREIPERMPVCSYYLQGSCSNPSCRFRHVKVNAKAASCQAFMKGFCPRGDHCPYRHSYVCPSLEQNGTCPNRERCPYHHPAHMEQQRSGTLSSTHHRNQGDGSVAEVPSLSELVPSFLRPSVGVE